MGTPKNTTKEAKTKETTKNKNDYEEVKWLTGC